MDLGHLGHEVFMLGEAGVEGLLYSGKALNYVDVYVHIHLYVYTYLYILIYMFLCLLTRL